MTAPQLVALEPRRRALTGAERRLLRMRGAELARRAAATGRVVSVGAAVTAVLWLVTLAVSETPWPWITLFWLVVGGAITLWVRSDARRDATHMRAQADALGAALERDQADVYDVEAAAYVELQEVEDEGACWAFQLDGERVVFVTGQEFHPGGRFPSLDFSLVQPLDQRGSPVDQWIEKRGEPVPPERVIPRETKARLEIPEHLSVRRGTLGELEAMLAGGAPGRSPDDGPGEERRPRSEERSVPDRRGPSP